MRDPSEASFFKCRFPGAQLDTDLQMLGNHKLFTKISPSVEAGQISKGVGYLTLYGVRGVAGSNFQHARSDKCLSWTNATDSVITIGCVGRLI